MSSTSRPERRTIRDGLAIGFLLGATVLGLIHGDLFFTAPVLLTLVAFGGLLLKRLRRARFTHVVTSAPGDERLIAIQSEARSRVLKSVLVALGAFLVAIVIGVLTKSALWAAVAIVGLSGALIALGLVRGESWNGGRETHRH
jgi:hypothetical protein